MYFVYYMNNLYYSYIMQTEKKIQLSYEISNLGNKTLKDEIEKYIKKHKKIFCK